MLTISACLRHGKVFSACVLVFDQQFIWWLVYHRLKETRVKLRRMRMVSYHNFHCCSLGVSWAYNNLPLISRVTLCSQSYNVGYEDDQCDYNYCPCIGSSDYDNVVVWWDWSLSSLASCPHVLNSLNIIIE